MFMTNPRSPEASSSTPDTTKEKQINTVERAGNILKNLIEGLQTTNMYQLAVAVSGLRKFQSKHPQYADTLNKIAEEAITQAKQAVTNFLNESIRYNANAIFPSEAFVQNLGSIMNYKQSDVDQLTNELKKINKLNDTAIDLAEREIMGAYETGATSIDVILKKPAIVFKDDKLQIITNIDSKTYEVEDTKKDDIE